MLRVALINSEKLCRLASHSFWGFFHVAVVGSNIERTAKTVKNKNTSEWLVQRDTVWLRRWFGEISAKFDITLTIVLAQNITKNGFSGYTFKYII